MKARPLPQSVERFKTLAEQEGLTNPLGRALHCANRRLNTWPKLKTPAHVMRSCRPTTAQRWLDHWMAGGSLHGLCYASNDAYLWSRAQRQGLSEGANLRRAIKRVRRTVRSTKENKS